VSDIYKQSFGERRTFKEVQVGDLEKIAGSCHCKVRSGEAIQTYKN
jgi:hypothetical protein